MVRLEPKKFVKTEWMGKWYWAEVKRVDASLVEMYFEADKRSEWIYRGSTRLEPLFMQEVRTCDVISCHVILVRSYLRMHQIFSFHRL